MCFCEGLRIRIGNWMVIVRGSETENEKLMEFF